MAMTVNDLALFLLVALPTLAIVLFLGMIVVHWSVILQMADFELVRLTGPEEDLARSRAEELIYPTWLKARRFDWVGVFHSQVEFEDRATIRIKARTCVWQQKNEHRYIAVHVTTVNTWTPTMASVDVYSLYGETHSITTTGSDNGPMYPHAPGRYRQILKSKRISELWDLHCETEVVLEPAIPEPKNQSDDRPFEEVLTRHVQDEAAHVRMIRLWPLRTPWWYFVNRRKNHGKKIVAQIGRE